MKKRLAIMFLGAVMAVSFFGLIILQATYLKDAADMHESQFNESVRRCLFHVSRVLEEEETTKFIHEAMGTERNISPNVVHAMLKINSPSGVAVMPVDTGYNSQMSCTRISPRVTITSKTGMKSTEPNTSLSKDKFKERYEQEKELMENILVRLLCDNYTMPINERIDLSRLDVMLDRELSFAGIDTPHRLAVINKDGTTVYKTKGYAPQEEQTTYMQVLFPHDPVPSGCYLKVYFPNRSSYIFSMVTLTVPSFILTALLLFTFIFSLVLITREKKLSQMRNDFMNNMTHELKTPVSSISLASQMLGDNSVQKTPERLAHLSGIIKDETKRLSQQIDKVLQMSILERESSALKLKGLDINDLVLTITSNFAFKVEAREGELETDIDAEDPFALVDEVHFTNIIYNLMDNALKYTTAVPYLRVRTWDDEKHLFISVADNGIGIKKSDQKKVFDKFFRVSTGSVHNVKGFGLGLAYVKKVVTDHRGTIKCESEFGKGTTFTICIPKSTSSR